MVELRASQPANRPQIRGLRKQIGRILSGEAEGTQVVIHDPRLLDFVRARAERAERRVEPGERGWYVMGRGPAQLRRVGQRWVAVRQDPEREGGAWVSVYAPVELSGQVEPTADLDVEAIHERLGCGGGEERARACEVLEAFAQAEAPGAGFEGGRQTWVGRVVAPPSEAGQGSGPGAGAVHLREAGEGEGLEIAFSEVSPEGEAERAQLEALLEATEAGEAPPKGNKAWAFIEQAGSSEQAFGELGQSEGVSGLVARTGVFRAQPRARTVTYFRRAGGRLFGVTHDHLGGRVWLWDLRRVVR